MKNGIRIRTVILLAALLLYTSLTASAAGMPVVYNSFMEGGSLQMIVGNLQGAKSVSCQIGNVRCENVSMSDEVAMETYLLIDNSLSIEDKYRGTIKEILLSLIGTVSERENVSVATFDQELHYLVQGSSDTEELKQAIEGIVYEDLDTKVTDVIYSLCKELESMPFDGLRRIVLISDGAEYSSVGFTRQEMLEEVQKLSYPIYTVGCTYGENTKELEDMFSLSRMTGAESFWLDEESDVQKITDGINECRQSVQVSIEIPDQLGDGTEKGVKLDFQTAEGETSVSSSAVMPFIEIEETDDREEETLQGDTKETPATEEPAEETSAETWEESQRENEETLTEDTEEQNPAGLSGTEELTERDVWGNLPDDTGIESENRNTEYTKERTQTELGAGTEIVRPETSGTEEATQSDGVTEEQEMTDSRMERTDDSEDSYSETEQLTAEKQTETEEQTEKWAETETEVSAGNEADGTEEMDFTVKLVLAGVLVLLVLFLLIRRKKRREEKRGVLGTAKNDSEIPTDFNDMPTDMGDDEPTMMPENERTLLMEEEDTAISGEAQARMNDFISIRFTDLQNPARMIEVPLVTAVSVGRSANKNQVVFDYERSVSSQHCEIIRRGNEIYIRDLNSLNGTWVDGEQIEEAELYDGAVIKLGRLEVRFEIV